MKPKKQFYFDKNGELKIYKDASEPAKFIYSELKKHGFKNICKTGGIYKNKFSCERVLFDPLKKYGFTVVYTGDKVHIYMYGDFKYFYNLIIDSDHKQNFKRLKNSPAFKNFWQRQKIDHERPKKERKPLIQIAKVEQMRISL